MRCRSAYRRGKPQVQHFSYGFSCLVSPASISEDPDPTPRLLGFSSQHFSIVPTPAPCPASLHFVPICLRLSSFPPLTRSLCVAIGRRRKFEEIDVSGDGKVDKYVLAIRHNVKSGFLPF